MPGTTIENMGTAVPLVGLADVPCSPGQVVDKSSFFLQACPEEKKINKKK